MYEVLREISEEMQGDDVEHRESGGRSARYKWRTKVKVSGKAAQR
jgi:hypothetical protein